MKKSYFKRLLIPITAFLNVFILNGSEDHTTSGRVGWKCENEPNKYWLLAKKLINSVFFWQDDHCKDSIETDEYIDYSFFGWNIVAIATVIIYFFIF